MGKEASRKHKHHKHIYIHHRNTQIKKILENFKKDIDSKTLTLGDFKTPLSKIDRSSKQNINMDTEALNNVLKKRTYLKEAKYTFFSNAHGTFSRTDCMIGLKTNLNKFKKTGIISGFFADHKDLKLETNLREKTQKP